LRKSDAGFAAAALAKRLFGDWQLPPDARFLVAYSGGLDSHVLLHALAALRPAHGFSLAAVHVDHALQSASQQWAAHCQRVCRILNIPLEVRVVHVDAVAEDGLEAAARRVRYAALVQILSPGEFLFTAHQQDDQAETLLLQLLRGAGVAGLAAMPERAAFGRGELLRPMLGFSRWALLAYARQHALEWIEDPSNRNLRLRRNFLRAEIVPRLEGLWPEARQTLARAAAHVAEAHALLTEIAVADLAVCRVASHRRYPEMLSVAALTQLTPERQRNLLRHWLRQQNFLAPAAHQLEELLRQIAIETRSRHARVHWEGVEVWRYRDRLVAVPACILPEATLDCVWDGEAPIRPPGLGELRAQAAWGQGLSLERMRRHGLHVRCRQGGESLRLAGRSHHHILKKLLQAAGVPPWERLRLPVFYADGKLAAVADRWVAAEFAAQSDEAGVNIVWDPFAEPEKIR
jgi:tRNA(Ile)-lysidine synthase